MPDEIDQGTIDLSARLMLHEFLLEILHFNIFRNTPDPQAEVNQFRDDLLDRIRNRPPVVQSMPVPDSILPVLRDRMAEIAETFALKVSKRLEE